MKKNKENSIDTLLDDLGGLGLDTTTVFYRPINYTKPITKKDVAYDFGYDLVQEYRTSNGIRMSSFTATDDTDTGTIFFNKNTYISFENACGVLDGERAVECITISLGNKTINIGKDTIVSISSLWRGINNISGYSPFGTCTPAIITMLLKLMKLHVNLETSEITFKRDWDTIKKILDRLYEKYDIFLFPIASKVAATTIGLDLVPVTPMAAPVGGFSYIDYIYGGTGTEVKSKE